MKILETIKGIITQCLGFHNVDQYIDSPKIEDNADVFEPKSIAFWWWSTPFKPGVYRYSNGLKIFYICRTSIGTIFPSLFRLILEPDVKLIPHPIRLMFGIFFVFFVVFGFIPLVYYLVSQPIIGIYILVFWVIFLVIVLGALHLEKKIAVNGFVRFQQSLDNIEAR